MRTVQLFDSVTDMDKVRYWFKLLQLLMVKTVHYIFLSGTVHVRVWHVYNVFKFGIPYPWWVVCHVKWRISEIVMGTGVKYLQICNTSPDRQRDDKEPPKALITSSVVFTNAQWIQVSDLWPALKWAVGCPFSSGYHGYLAGQVSNMILMHY